MPKWRAGKFALRLPVQESQSVNPIDRSIKGFPRATRQPESWWRRMHGQPMIGDFSAGADPDTLTLAYMIEEADQAR
jgi:hypothetical protein